jgi:formylglycine-generating enzyme required for sulfatase activity
MAAVLAACDAGTTPPSSPERPAPPAPLLKEAPGLAPEGMVWIPGGEFEMGSDAGQRDERPPHRVALDGFWMDRHEVTNRRFARFVEATGYVTTSERRLKQQDVPFAPNVPPEGWPPGSLVFKQREQAVDLKDWRQWWEFVEGADWRHPLGPESDLKGKEEHPVVHVSWDDAVAYARWAGKQLPTEAQWEYAARGGLAGKKCPWGDETKPGGRWTMNIWQGQFPVADSVEDGFHLTAPVGSYPPNGYGLFDMAGNVWEWCADWYASAGYAESGGRNPTGPREPFDEEQPDIPKRVTRGGSFLCSDQYCSGYRVTARMKTSPDTGLLHTGFRCVIVPKR